MTFPLVALCSHLPWQLGHTAKMVETQGPQQDSSKTQVMRNHGHGWYGMVWNGVLFACDKNAEHLILSQPATNRSLSHATLPAYQGIDLQAGKEEGGPKLSPMEEQLVLAS